jgi:hypothetical protein
MHSYRGRRPRLASTSLTTALILRHRAGLRDARARVPGEGSRGPRSRPHCGISPISLLCLSGVTEITRTLQAIARERTRILDYLPL